MAPSVLGFAVTVFSAFRYRRTTYVVREVKQMQLQDWAGFWLFCVPYQTTYGTKSGFHDRTSIKFACSI